MIETKSNKVYSFLTDTVGFEVAELKGDKKYYITGYISTKDKDLVDDIVTEEALSGMLKQLHMKNIKLDVEHEAWRNDNPAIIPIGRIIEASRDQKGLFIKAELNKSHSRFREVWNSIKDGFIDAFSIAYKAIKYAYKNISGSKVRMLGDVELLNVAITGNPVNPECRMIEVFTKSLDDIKEEKMKEETETNDIVDNEEVEEKEEPKEESTESTETVEPKEDLEDEYEEKTNEFEEKALKLSNENKDLRAKLSSLEAEVKDLKEILEKPIIKAEQKSMDKELAEVKTESVNPLDAI